VTIRRKSFGSDNHSGAHPEVLQAIAEANVGDALPYGTDPWTRRAQQELCSIFGASDALLVFNGTAANVLGVSLLLKPYEAVVCADCSHLNVDECGATERILGNKLLTIATPDGKLTPDLIRPRLTGRGDEHRAQPRVVEITQVTEVGTCYSLDELRQLSDFCRTEGLYLFMDGARLANAAAHLGCELAELAAGVDALSFGGTKNGAVAAEAVILMREDLTESAPFLRKQQLQLGSKMRFTSAQFVALLTDQLWLRSAQHANVMASRLAAAVAGLPGVEVSYPVQSNAVFAVLDPARAAALQEDWTFYFWDSAVGVVRWMTSFATTEEDVDSFAAAIRASGAAAGAGTA
jgi:threonine aldolase